MNISGAMSPSTAKAFKDTIISYMILWTFKKLYQKKGKAAVERLHVKWMHLLDREGVDNNTLRRHTQAFLGEMIKYHEDGGDLDDYLPDPPKRVIIEFYISIFPQEIIEEYFGPLFEEDVVDKEGKSQTLADDEDVCDSTD
jgi:hypothetical protein